MFGFKVRKSIAARAQFLGELVPLLHRNANAMPFEEFVEDNRRRGFVDSYIDTNVRSYGFFEPLPPGATYSDLAFCVQYEAPPSSPRITVEGKHYYYGCNLSCADEGRLVVSLVTDTIPIVELGRYARDLRAALLRLPNVTTLTQMMRRLGA
jgi:hypothetical protein